MLNGSRKSLAEAGWAPPTRPEDTSDGRIRPDAAFPRKDLRSLPSPPAAMDSSGPALLFHAPPAEGAKAQAAPVASAKVQRVMPLDNVIFFLGAVASRFCV